MITYEEFKTRSHFDKEELLDAVWPGRVIFMANCKAPRPSRRAFSRVQDV